MQERPNRSIVLYDDRCGICRWWIPLWATTLARRGIGIAPLQDRWVKQQLQLGGAELLADLRLFDPDGKHLTGADVYRYVMRRIWWAYPLYLLSVAPLTSALFSWGYRTFADNRMWISGVCRFDVGASSASDLPSRV